jgi:hypothetical protein
MAVLGFTTRHVCRNFLIICIGYESIAWETGEDSFLCVYEHVLLCVRFIVHQQVFL